MQKENNTANAEGMRKRGGKGRKEEEVRRCRRIGRSRDRRRERIGKEEMEKRKTLIAQGGKERGEGEMERKRGQ